MLHSRFSYGLLPYKMHLMNMAKHMWALSIYKRKVTSIALIVSHLFVVRVSILWVRF
jgi:hypothetical protein